MSTNYRHNIVLFLIYYGFNLSSLLHQPKSQIQLVLLKLNDACDFWYFLQSKCVHKNIKYCKDLQAELDTKIHLF